MSEIPINFIPPLYQPWAVYKQEKNKKEMNKLPKIHVLLQLVWSVLSYQQYYYIYSMAAKRFDMEKILSLMQTRFKS